jgi:hypothetical protein
MLSVRVLDPDPDWTRIQRLSGPGSVVGSGSRGKKLNKFQWKKCALVIFYKNVTTNKVKNSTNYFFSKGLN